MKNEEPVVKNEEPVERKISLDDDNFIDEEEMVDLDDEDDE